MESRNTRQRIIPRDKARKGRRSLCGPAGFSLIELLITMAILIILVTLYWGSGSPSYQRKQKQRCQEHLQKIYLAMEIYANDNSGKFPYTAGAKTSEEALDVLVPRYTADTSIFVCPGSEDAPLPAGESFLKRRISYAYYMGHSPSDKTELLMSDRQIDTLPKKEGQPVFSSTGKPPGNNHHKYGGNFLFVDGHLESSESKAPFSLAFTQSVTLLNPKP